MAIDPSASYPGQVDTSDPTGYPHGKAQNSVALGDGLGFPLEKAWVNDFLGFAQALLSAASIFPSGTPDKVGASQYLTALNVLAPNVQLFTANGTWTRPANAVFVDICVVGDGFAGGAGGASSGAGAGGGGGGSSGGFMRLHLPVVLVPPTLTIALHVGAGLSTVSDGGSIILQSQGAGSAGFAGGISLAGAGGGDTPPAIAPGAGGVAGSGAGGNSSSSSAVVAGGGGGGIATQPGGVGGAGAGGQRGSGGSPSAGGSGGLGYGAGGGGGSGGNGSSTGGGGGGGAAGFGHAVLATAGGNASGTAGGAPGAGASGCVVITTWLHL